MTLRFNPPKDKKLPRYASYGAGILKTHTEVAYAKLSLAHRLEHRANDDSVPYYSRPWKWHEGYILEMVDGAWYVLYHVEEGTDRDHLPWKKKAWRHRDYYSWGRRYDKPTYNPESYIEEYVSVPMTKDEYADWRIKVELERLGIDDTIRGQLLTANGMG